MKIGVLFSGGKDSTYALHKAASRGDVVCLITLASGNPESYMFHTPNIEVTALQADALRLPIIRVETEGVKEMELLDLSKAIISAKKVHAIEGVVTGAIESVYQAQRIQTICDRLGLWCFNPLWKINQVRLLRELVRGGFEVMISGVFAYPFDESWLGRRIDEKTVAELEILSEKYKISPSGEGGEIETTVLDAPMFRKRIHITDHEIIFKNNAGVYIIKGMELVEK